VHAALLEDLIPCSSTNNLGGKVFITDVDRALGIRLYDLFLLLDRGINNNFFRFSVLR